MIIQIIHLSDVHFSVEKQLSDIDIDKIIQVFNSKPSPDFILVVFSGDITSRGYTEHYEIAIKFIDKLVLKIKNKTGLDAEICLVPGNHDINFNGFEIDLNTIQTEYKNKTIENVIHKYIDHMGEFYEFASAFDCFSKNRIISKKIIKCGEIKVGVVMVNSASLSLLGGASVDMGYHFLSEELLGKIRKEADCQFNILVMHHSIEWFEPNTKSELRNILFSKYNLILFGHEHEAVGEGKKTSRMLEYNGIQGNALLGNTKEGNGFGFITLDVSNDKILGESYLWKTDYYSSKIILESKLLLNKASIIKHRPEFICSIKKDEKGKKIDEYYTFPGLEINKLDDRKDVNTNELENENELLELISKHKITNICGAHKSGKTVLAAMLYLALIEKGGYPIIIYADDINKRKIDLTTIRGFEEQYYSENSEFEKFTQLNINDRYVILDDASKIEKKTLKSLINHFEKYFGSIVLLCEEIISLDIKRQVIDEVEEDNIQLNIKPFLYSSRHQLISKLLLSKGISEQNVEQKARDINNLINIQIKYFDLNPDFIISFVNQYEAESEQNIHFTPGMNVFNIVYDNAIKTRIIDNSVGNISPSLVINVLRELAYYMHFLKKSSVSQIEFDGVVNDYNKEYRQNVNARIVLNIAIDSKILKDNSTGIYFIDRTLVAYFVAQAINHKYNCGEDTREKTDYLLKHLCFGINSDILLFLTLITNNPQILNIIIQGAKEHFKDQEELSFDKSNISFLMETNLPVKKSVPNQKDKEQREKKIDVVEREIKIPEIVELVNEYDYSEEDLKQLQNQVMISFKYIELLSKVLPAFCQEMKAKQQDELVSLIYQCPNQFLFMLFNDIAKDYDKFCRDLHDEIMEYRNNRNQPPISYNSIKSAIAEVSATIVLGLYQLVASSSASLQSKEALNAFFYDENANYRIMNLMINSKVESLSDFSVQARKIDKKAKTDIEHSMIWYTVREYFLRNNLKIYGEAESLMTYFLSDADKKNMKRRLIKKRYNKKHIEEKRE